MQNDFKRLNIWQEAMRLVTNIYDLSSKFPETEKFGLVSQMRRSAVSIPSNIAEGSGRGTNPQFLQFLSIAQGSAFELETQLLLAEKLNLVSSSEAEDSMEILHAVQKMNFRFRQSLLKRNN